MEMMRAPVPQKCREKTKRKKTQKGRKERNRKCPQSTRATGYECSFGEDVSTRYVLAAVSRPRIISFTPWLYNIRAFENFPERAYTTESLSGLGPPVKLPLSRQKAFPFRMATLSPSQYFDVRPPSVAAGRNEFDCVVSSGRNIKGCDAPPPPFLPSP